MKKFLLLIALVSPCYPGDLHAQPVAVEELTRTTKSWDGSELPPYNSGQPEITILRVTVQPNSELSWHTHPSINAGVMVKGQLTVITTSGEKHELVAGDTVVEVIGKIHRGLNTGSEPAEIIVFYAGVVETPLTVKVE